jgi:hypothetical protein
MEANVRLKQPGPSGTVIEHSPPIIPTTRGTLPISSSPPPILEHGSLRYTPRRDHISLPFLRHSLVIPTAPLDEPRALEDYASRRALHLCSIRCDLDRACGQPLDAARKGPSSMTRSTGGDSRRSFGKGEIKRRATRLPFEFCVSTSSSIDFRNLRVPDTHDKRNFKPNLYQTSVSASYLMSSPSPPIDELGQLAVSDAGSAPQSSKMVMTRNRARAQNIRRGPISGQLYNLANIQANDSKAAVEDALTRPSGLNVKCCSASDDGSRYFFLLKDGSTEPTVMVPSSRTPDSIPRCDCRSITQGKACQVSGHPGSR